MKTGFFFLIFLFGIYALKAENSPGNFNLSFRRISPPGGFTYGAINSIGEDSDGFIWFGTVHGLYCYNTAEVIKFTHNPLDSTSIPGNSIRAIYRDMSGLLWIGSTQGLCIYDKNQNRFKRKFFFTTENEFLGNYIRDIFQLEDNSIYFLSSTMLGKLEIESGQLNKLIGIDSSNEIFTCSEYDANGNVWIGGINGSVWKYNTNRKSIEKFCQFRNESISRIFADDNGIWIGYSYAGLDFSDHKGNFIEHYGGRSVDKKRISHDRVRDIYKDSNGNMWVSTYKGFTIISKEQILNLQPQEITGLPYNSIYKIFHDSKNGIWIGTWSGGLAYRSEYDNRFIHSRKNNSESVNDDEFVSSFAEKTDGTILIGTEFGNLYTFDRQSNKMIKTGYNTSTGRNIENIKSLEYDDDTQTLWVGTFLDGLWYQNKHDGVLHPFTGIKTSRLSVYSLLKNGIFLYIGTYGQGLYRYNTQTGEIKSFISSETDTTTLSENHIRAIVAAGDNSIWVGTNNGLNKLNPETGKFKRFNHKNESNNSISGDEVFFLQTDRSGNLWIGTSGGGLNRLNVETEKFDSWTTGNGLSGNDVYGITVDNKNLLWLSTDNGITQFDPANNTFRNFGREDELQGSQFNPGAVFQTSSGEIMFGDTKGFTYFIPDQMKKNPNPPKVILTSLAINNKKVHINSEDSPFTGTLQSQKSIKLSFQQNSLTFSFVANNFLLPQKNNFKYRLVNYDKVWIDAGNQKFATYTKIPPGDYIFEVNASNNDDLWNDVPAQLRVRIDPPFWLSWYAYIFYFIIVGLLSYFIVMWIMERQQFKKELLKERYARESEVQLRELKLRFFTNISHEFRTPLTLITLPVTQLLDKTNLEPFVKEQLTTVQRNSIRLLRLINQFMDIRKLESGKAILNLRKTEVVSICKEIINSFTAELEEKQVDLSFRYETDKIYAFVDSEKFDKIFFNILANAVKFTPEGGSIRITLYTTLSEKVAKDSVLIGEPVLGNKLCLNINDNGPGIPSQEIKSIFERFEQGTNNSSIGTGIGLHMALEYTKMHGGNIEVKSRPGSGTEFKVCIPVKETLSISNEDLVDTGNLKEKLKNEEISNEQFNNQDNEKKITVLLIEDNFELRKYLKELLKLSYKVVVAVNGKQGLDTATTILPDLIITDLILPLMDGIEICRQLKNNPLTNHIPVIILSAIDEPEKKIDGLRLGVEAYITKPFDGKILVAQIENSINKIKQLKEILTDSDKKAGNNSELFYSDELLIKKATAIIENNLHENDFNVDELAEGIGFSSSTLYRKLKSATNQSPSEFIRYVRLKKAVSLMENGITNIDEISYSVGFNSHSYFSSSFKKQFGKTPLEFIQEARIRDKTK